MESAPHEGALGLRDRVLMELIYGAGLRVSEAVGLRIEQLDLDSASLVVTGKRGKTRWIPLPRETVEWLDKWMTEGRPQVSKKPRAEVLLGARGGPLNRRVALEIIAQSAKKAGIEKAVSPHTLRHTYAVDLLKGGADLRAVQELLGHESITTTQIYTELDREQLALQHKKAHPRR